MKGRMLEQGRGLLKKLGRFKYVLLVAVAGLILLLLPTSETEEQEQAVAGEEEDFSVEALEEKLSAVLSQVEGAGEVTVMLTVENGVQRILAQNETSQRSDGEVSQELETVVISSGSSQQEVVLVGQIYPTFQGALVVASGAANPAVCLKLTEAVAALTGLGADKISVCEGK
ncbi:MAG: stage III sporulation protein AG [Oscillospiraceae bacterium]|nr:stage III sporulation protein AG [Oscillospiraceae bacterium]